MSAAALAACRAVLLDSLRKAVAQTPAQVRPGDADCPAGRRWCACPVVRRTPGGVTDPKSTRRNRPTCRQVVPFPSHR